MNKKRKCIYLAAVKKIIILFLAITFKAQAQDPVGVQGVEAAGIGGAASTLTNNWSVYNNPAGLALVDKFQLGFMGSQVFGVDLLYVGAIACAVPVKNLATLGFSFSQVSFGTYQSIKTGFCLSRSFGPKVSAGMQAHYQLLQIAQYPNAQSLQLDLGMRIQASDLLAFGLHIYNPFPSQLSAYQDERWPSFMRFGASYKLSKNVTLLGELEATGSTDLIQKLGLTYELKPNWILRCGLRGMPLESFFGLGIKTKYLQINLAFGFHTYLGTTPYFGLDYEAQK